MDISPILPIQKDEYSGVWKKKNICKTNLLWTKLVRFESKM